jgi:TPR repeat protein
MYQQGEGVQQDFKQAVVWYRKAADQEDAKAQLSFGAGTAMRCHCDALLG